MVWLQLQPRWLRRFLLLNRFLKGYSVCWFDIVIPPVTEHRTDIYGTHRSNRFDATVVDRCIGCIISGCADAYGSDSVVVHIQKCGQVIDHRADLFRSDVRVLQLAQFAYAFTLVGSVKSNRDEPF